MAKSKEAILSQMGVTPDSDLNSLLEALKNHSIVTDNEKLMLKQASVQTLPTVVRNNEQLVKEKMHGIVTNEEKGAIALMNKRNVLLEQIILRFKKEILSSIDLSEGVDDTKISTLYNKFSDNTFLINYYGPYAYAVIMQIDKNESTGNYFVNIVEPFLLKTYTGLLHGDSCLCDAFEKMDYPSNLAQKNTLGVINLGEIDSPYITNNEKLNAIKDTTKLYSFTYSKFPYLMQIYSPEGVTYYQHIYCINSTADNAGKPRIYTRKINSDSTVKLLGYTEIPTKVSQLENDRDYATKDELFSKDYNDLINKPEIPNKLSELEQDIEFISEEQVTEIVTNNFKKLSVSELKDGIKYAKYLGKYDLVMDEQANDGYGGVKRFIQRIYNEYGIVRNEYGGYITTIYYAELIGYRGNMDATGHYIIFQEGTSFYCFKMPAHASMRICAYTIDVVTPDNINGIQLKNYEMYPLKSEIPTKVSQLENDSEFINNSVNNLVNYYLKTETYTKQEVLDLIGQISTMSLKVVTTLPSTDISTTTIYLVSITGDANNNYEEYIYVNNQWEMIGTTKVNLDDYVQKNSNAQFNTVDVTEQITIGGKNVALEENIPVKVSELENDADYAKRNELFSKDYNDLLNKPEIPSKLSDLEEDIELIDEEQVMEIIEENSEEAELINLEEIELLDIGTSENYNVQSDKQIPTTKAVKKIIDNSYTTAEKEKLAQLHNYDDTEIKSSITDLENSKVDRSEMPVVLSDISAFNNDVGYLTEHQDISHLASTSYVDEQSGIQDTKIQDINNQLDSFRSSYSGLRGEIETVENIALGANKALSFANYSSMIRYLLNSTDVLQIGQNIYIQTLNVPDLWISEYVSGYTDYTYVDDATFISSLKNDGFVTIGGYRVSSLETQKVDLTDYVPKTTTVNGHALSSNVTVTKSDVGLGNVLNVASYSKTETDNKLGEKATTTTVNNHINNKSNPHGVTKAQVGLGNVLNVASYSKTEVDNIKNDLIFNRLTQSSAHSPTKSISNANTTAINLGITINNWSTYVGNITFADYDGTNVTTTFTMQYRDKTSGFYLSSPFMYYDGSDWCHCVLFAWSDNKASIELRNIIKMNETKKFASGTMIQFKELERGIS